MVAGTSYDLAYLEKSFAKKREKERDSLLAGCLTYKLGPSVSREIVCKEKELDLERELNRPPFVKCREQLDREINGTSCSLNSEAWSTNPTEVQN